MKNLLKMMAVFGVVNTPTYMLMANHTNGVVETQLEQRSLNSDSENTLIDAYDIVYQDTNVGAYLDTLTNEIGLNSIAIHNNALALNGVKDEMLYTDTYETTCEIWNDVFETYTFHHHYTDNRDVEHWKYSRGTSFGYVVGDYEFLKQHMLGHACNWW